MKKTTYIFLISLIIFLVNPALGFAGMTKSNPAAQSDLTNVTESDEDIVLRQHFIEVDALQLQSQNKLYVSEMLIFKNTGNKNFSGSLRTWVPDGAEIIKRNESGEIEKREMITGEKVGYLPIVRNGNIVSWRDNIATNTLAPIYVIEYLLPGEPEGITKTKYYSKKLNYPTLINYKYEGRGLYSIVIKVITSEESSITLQDENRNKISPDEVSREGSSIISRFSSPQFKEFTIGISKPAITPAIAAGYVVLGIAIILAFSYPLMRKKSEKIQALEEKIRSSLKREEAEETVEEAVEETDEEAVEETTSEPAVSGEAVAPAGVDTEFEGKTREDLENLKNEMLSKLGELDKEYESGNLLDEEYEELRKSYDEKVKRITKKIEQLYS